MSNAQAIIALDDDLKPVYGDSVKRDVWTREHVIVMRKVLAQQLARWESIRICCMQCEHLGTNGVCDVFDMTPPDDFRTQENQCDAWRWDQVPF